MIYIVVFLFLLYPTIYYDIQGNSRGKSKYERIAVVILILLSGLRNQVGSDTFAYEYQYRFFPTIFGLFEKGIDLKNLSEPLWVILNCTFKTISDDFFLLQFFIAVVFNWSIYYFFKSVSKKVFSCLLLFYCTQWYGFNFEILRESLSVAIYLVALVDYLKHNKLPRYFLICVPAILVHWFAFAMVLITPLFIMVNRKISLPIATLLGLGIIFMGGSAIIEAFNYMSLYIEGDKALRYLSEWNTRELTFYIIFVQGVLLRIILPLSILASGSEDEESRDMVVLKRILVIYILIGGLATHIIIAYRLLHYIYPVLLVLAVEAFGQTVSLRPGRVLLRKKKLLITYTLAFCMICMVFFDIKGFVEPNGDEFRSNVKYDCRYFPYTSVFEKKNEKRTQYFNSTSHTFYDEVFGD